MALNIEYRMDQKQAHKKCTRFRREGKLIPPGRCELCGCIKNENELVMHHAYGYKPPNDTHIMWVCKKANSTMNDEMFHGDLDIETTRELLKIKVKKQGFLFDVECGIEKFIIKNREWACKFFINWSAKQIYDDDKSFLSRKRRFIHFVEREKGGRIAYKVKMGLSGLNEYQIDLIYDGEPIENG